MKLILLLAVGAAIFLFSFSAPSVQDLIGPPEGPYKIESETQLPKEEKRSPVEGMPLFTKASTTVEEVRPTKEIHPKSMSRFEYAPPPSKSLSAATSTGSKTVEGVEAPTFPIPSPAVVKETSLPLPPLNEEAIFKSVVKIECPTKDGLGKYIGSGFVLEGDRVVTAAHVVSDSSSKECAVIFPSERKPIHYLKGTIRNLDKLKERLDKEGIDFALLDLPALASYPEARAIFSSYPFVPYSFCEDPKMLGDTTYHYGYPANFKDLEYLERLKGEALEYADIEGTKPKISEDGTTYKAPIFSFSRDESRLHPYMVSRTGVFYGASGGLAFNVTKQCILGPHHGFSAGTSESFSIFMILAPYINFDRF